LQNISLFGDTISDEVKVENNQNKCERQTNERWTVVLTMTRNQEMKVRRLEAATFIHRPGKSEEKKVTFVD
jgi:hypothetical protein